MAWIFLLLFCAAVTASIDEHSLFYTYTALSKPVDLPGIYQFTALGTLDDRELDYYNSQTQVKVPKQNWMKEKMSQDYWEKGTASRKSKEQWFKVNVDILIDRMRHNKTDLHVLQWRHGCKIEGENGNNKFVKGIDEYSYDGAEFLSFDEINSRWIAPVQAAEPTKRKWDGVDILNQYTKSYLEKECVDWLTKFMGYGQEELKQFSPPVLHLFAKKSVKDSKRLTLTCLATGFYPQNMQMQMRKSRTSIPEHLLTSSGVRPNGDGTYQLRKSLEILKDEKALYDCQVSHITLKEPATISPGKDIPCLDCSGSVIWGVTGGLVTGVLLTLVMIAGFIVFLIKTGRITWKRNSRNVVARAVPAPAFLPVSVLVSPPVPAPVSSSDRSINMMSDSKDADSVKKPDAGKDSGTESAGGSQENMNKETKRLVESDSAAGSSSDGSQQSSCENISEQTPMLDRLDPK